jgi:NitT/TauT family transport system ATP-binding protein
MTVGNAAGAVDISRVNVDYRDKKGAQIAALAPTSLKLEPGSFTALVGPSGCGKSTLLNIVAGFVKPTNGAAILDGKEISGPTPDVGVVFQQYALFPWFTALGNIEFALKRLKLPARERRERALQALAEVGLQDRAQQFPGNLSGGMKQRVALARTFVASPKVLLMDEPFGALDAITRVTMQRLLLDIWQRHKATVLFVTHDIDEALFLADRVHVMSKGPGRIVETIDVADPRPRSVEKRSEHTSAAHTRILDLLLTSDHD